MNSPLPGWYPNPAGTGPARWWDGAQWGPEAEPLPDERGPAATAPGPMPAPAPAPVPMPARAARPRQPSKPMIVIGALLLLVGVAVAVVAVVMIARSDLVALFTTESVRTPATITMELDEGEHTLYSDRVLDLTTVRVEGPDGEVELRTTRVQETIDRGTQTFQGRARFDVDTAGEHRITVDDVADVFVGPSLTNVGLDLGIGLAVGGFAGLLLVGGLVLVLVGALRRAKAAPAAA